jgi:YbbR domain-containing protein
LFRNIPLKLLALAFAIALWGVVAYAENPTQSQTFNVDVDKTSLPAGLVIVGSLPRVRVTATGAADNLSKFDKNTVHAVGDFAHVKPGINRVTLTITNTDPTITVSGPNVIVLNIDQIATVTQSVTAQTVHPPPDGFHIVSITPATDKVTVLGPKSSLNGISVLAQIDLSQHSQPFDWTGTLTIVDSDKKVVPQLIADPAQIIVHVVIQADSVTETKSVGFSTVGQPAAGFRVTNVQVSPLTVNATGLAAALAGLNQITSDPVDITGARDDVIRTVTLRPPAGITLSQRTVQVHVFIARIPAPPPTPSPSPSPS